MVVLLEIQGMARLMEMVVMARLVMQAMDHLAEMVVMVRLAEAQLEKALEMYLEEIYHLVVDLIMENQVFLEKVEEIHQYLIQK